MRHARHLVSQTGASQTAVARLSGLTGILLFASLTACGPVSPELAAKQCTERARAATGPTGKIEIGGGNRGFHTGVEIGITSDFILGRDPQLVYENCVFDKTGQGPIRPLVL